MATQLQGGNTPCLAATPSDPRPTVLVFDSGVGGLSVYNEIRSLLPDLHYIYAFDNVAFPYGERAKIIVERVVEIVTAVQQRYPLSLAVIACNTASTVSLPALREKFAFPVVGVVPAIKPAARLTANGVVGLLATRATVKRSYTHELIARLLTNVRLRCWVPPSWWNWRKRSCTAKRSLWRGCVILRPWLRMSEPPDTVVLGCTHFPLLQEELTGPAEGTRLVDSGAAIARRTAWLLEHEAQDAKSTDENVAFCMAMTTEAEQLLPVLQRYGFKTLEKLSV
ncbi:glutamate racemase [Shigella flexneri]